MKKKTLSSSTGLSQSLSDTKVSFSQTMTTKNLSATGGTASLNTTAKLFGTTTEKKSEAEIRREKARKIRQEKQGPIDWSHLGIKLKYRGEAEREQAWIEWKKNNQGALTMTVNSRGEIVPVMKIERHPIYDLYYERLGLENTASNERTRSRLLMKRFVLDVQEIWLANLEHLREHQPDKAFLANGNSNLPKIGKASEEDEVEEQNYARGEGLAYRRDVKEIKAYSSQVQSVSQKRIFTKAYYTAKLPAVNVMLDYVPESTPVIEGIKPTIPKIQSLLTHVCYLPTPSSSSSSSTISDRAIYYLPMDSSAYLKSSIAFQIDRLIPSNDLSRITDETWWRFTVTNSETLKTRLFVTSETEIASFVAQLISSPTAAASAEAAQPSYQEIYSTEKHLAVSDDDRGTAVQIDSLGELSLPYDDGSIEWKGKVKVYSFRERGYLKFVISAEITPSILSETHRESFQPIALHFFSSPLEIRSLLSTQQQQQLNIPLFDESWWGDHNRREREIWHPLLALLRLELDRADPSTLSLAEGLVAHIPVGLHFLPEKKVAGYSDCLPTLQAISCVQELFSAIQMYTLPSQETLAPQLSIAIPAAPSHPPSNGDRAAVPPPLRILSLREVQGDSFFHQMQHFYNRDAKERKICTKQQQEEERKKKHTTSAEKEEEKKAEPEISKEEAEVKEEDDDDDDDPLLSQSWSEKARYYFQRGLWESLLELGPSLSFVSNHLIARYLEVPGGSELGRHGLSFLPDHLFPLCPRSQVAGNYFRDYEHSSTNSIIVNLSLAIDVARLFPSLYAWEGFPQLPPAVVGDDPPETVPLTALHQTFLSLETLNSPIEKRLSNTIVIFASVAVEGLDFAPRSSPVKALGYRRHVPVKNDYGYREQIEVSLLQVDPVNEAIVYGITKTGAVPNELKTNSRNIWHSSVAINENINRPRTPKDYLYIILKKNDQGANIPTSYTTRMKSDEMVGLTSSAFKHYEENYEKIKELKEVFNRQLALDAKIEKIENDLKTKEAMIKRKIQDQLQRKLEKKLNKATKSEIGWRRRYKYSTLLELQGNWEYRRDDRNGLKFFHRILSPDSSQEKFAETCQWEVPSTWESDVLKQLTANGQRPELTIPKEAFKTGSVASSLADDRTYLDHLSEVNDPFAEPASTWAPQDTRRRAGARAGDGDGLSSVGGSLPPAHPLNALVKGGKAAGGRTVASDDLDSVRADRSLQESAAATIDTVNLEHIAEQLLSSDEVLRVLAKRLGLPEDQIVPADELSSVFSLNSNHFQQETTDDHLLQQNEGRLNAPRERDVDFVEEIEFDSDDDLWSDDGEEVGDFEVERYLGLDLPENQLEAAQLRREENKESAPAMDEHSVPSKVPYLQLEAVIGKDSNLNIEHNEERYGWRRLPRPHLTTAFLTEALKTHVRGPDISSCNTLNAPIFLSPIAPIDAIRYVPENHVATIESLFVPDAKKDMERSIATLQRNIKREEELARNMATDDLLLFGEANEFTAADLAIAKQYQKDKAAVSDPKEMAKDAALMAAKATNIAQMEDALAEDIPINTADDFGNTLLILAAQQGSKRMCKFLLRRGANINIQNLTGNTALHYCYAYSNLELAEYLKSKGADDSIINVDGLTCYEGLNQESMNKEYADYDEEDYEEGAGAEEG